jgi:phospholipid/cholesterol/gamma-HCH transport system substrate-binding protein
VTRSASRAIAAAGLVVAVVVVAVLLLTGGSSYTVKATFLNASQIVNGNLVQVSGVSVGKVTDLQLTGNGQAQLTLQITDHRYVPLRRGTRFVVRQASLSGQANRYIDLQLPPGDAGSTGTWGNGAVIPASDTASAVDLDQLLNTFTPSTRVGLQRVIRGSASQYAGEGQVARVGWQYLNPFVASSAALFAELDRDTPKLRRFVVQSGSLVHNIAQRRNDLANLVGNLGATTAALARPPGALGRAVAQLPGFMRQANTTFVNLRSTLDTLKPLVDESKPVARKLQPFLATLRPFARDAAPTVRDLAEIVRRPGPANDLTDLLALTPPLAKVTVGKVHVDGKLREGSFPSTARALSGATPLLAFARPYTVDLTGWFDDFSHSGVYDALGGSSRASPVFAGLGPASGRLASFLSTAAIHQFDRCPGSAARPAADGSNPYKPTADYPCNPSQVPPGK